MIDYSTEDLKGLCSCFDTLLFDSIYSKILSGDDCEPFSSLSLTSLFCDSYHGSVPNFMYFLRKEFQHKKTSYGRIFHEAINVPFNQVPLHLNKGGAFRTFLEYRLVIGK